MRFSDAFLRQVRDRVSISDFAGRRLAWDKRKSRPAAGDFWACCPFHQEKSPSFHVLDGKGIFNCFGCGEKGDVFGLAMKLDGVSFPEAVTRLAELAGVALPAEEVEDRDESDRRKRLYAAMNRAAAFYADALASRDGRDARDYLRGRGFTAELCAAFSIGYAPDSWSALIDKLRPEFSIDELIAAGLARESERNPIDTFRNRITFEITDPSGRVIAFGARALEKDAKAKYINSPETPLYSKSRVLYRLKQAREIAAKTKAAGVVVAEGYLDVIALERAGIGAVAPCGTALTEDQLQLVWRAGGEPILCFDGDDAGRRAADRALDLALPHLGPGKTVRIALLPPGQDPDDVFRNAGPQALAPLVAAARPASDALYEREKARRTLSTPEARADFKARLREAASAIADPETKRLYLSDLLRRADALIRPPWVPNARGDFKGKGKPPAPATPELTATVAAGVRLKDPERFLRAVIDYPDHFRAVADWIDRLTLDDPDLEAIRLALQALQSVESDLQTIDRTALSLHLSQSGEERAAARLSRWPKGRVEVVAEEWLALVTREVVLPAIREELAELRPLADGGDEGAFARFQTLSREVREIEARAREAKLNDVKPDDTAAEDLVA